MHIRNARADELDKVLELYRSVRQSEFCVWNDSYPGAEEIERDSSTDNLFVLLEDGEVIGAISVVPENELDHLPFWRFCDGTQREIARVAVAEERQGQGLAVFMVKRLLELLKQSGCSSVRLSAACKNIPAVRTYLKAGFEMVGETDMYNSRYYLFEKLL